MKKIQLPESQTQEVLYELINRLYIDRKTMMLSCGVANLTAQISILSNKGVKITTNEIPFNNKYGRQSTFAQYSLENKKDAVIVYEELKANQRHRVCSNPFYDFDDCEIRESIGCLNCQWYEVR